MRIDLQIFLLLLMMLHSERSLDTCRQVQTLQLSALLQLASLSFTGA